MKLFAGVLILSVGLVSFSPNSVYAQQGISPPIQIEGYFKSFNQQILSVFVLVNGQEQSFGISAQEKEILLEQLKRFNPGDLLTLQVAKGPPDLLKGVVVKSVSVSRKRRGVVFAAFTIGIWLVIFVSLYVLKRATQTPTANMLVGEDNRYSKSKFQFALWFIVWLGSYLAIFYFRLWACGNCFLGGISIPDELLLLSGFSAGSFAAAKTITTIKDINEKTANRTGKTSGKIDDRKFLRNLLTNDQKQADLGDIQMLIVTLLAVGIYVLSVFKFLGTIECLKTVSLPNVDTALLALFGIGQGAYLGKKAGGKVGDS